MPPGHRRGVRQTHKVRVAPTVVAAPVAAPAVGAARHPALLALPSGVEYVHGTTATDTDSPELKIAPLMPTDAVVEVFALDHSLFDAANAAKRRVHLCVGGRGTLDTGDGGFCLTIGPCVPPWTLHFIFFCPFICEPQIDNLCRAPHADMPWPPWAEHALIVTEKGVVGRRRMRPDRNHGDGLDHFKRDVNAIAWDGFDVDNIQVRRYAEDEGCYICDSPPLHPDPLSYLLGFGLVLPCCFKVLVTPTTPGLYHAKIESDHTTDKIKTAEIDLIALARSPEDLLASLRAAKARYGAPAVAAMER